jgi:hypothetical protein
MKIRIEATDYLLCEQSASNMASNKKKGFYGSGLLNTKGDPYRAERTGRLGELGLARYLKVEPNFDYLIKGDEYDFIYEGNRIDVKTSRYNYGCGLVLAVTEFGVYKPLTSDIYVFGYIEHEDRKKKIADINYCGFIFKENVIREPVVGRKAGSRHLNFEIPYSELEDFNDKISFTLSGRKNKSITLFKELSTS